MKKKLTAIFLCVALLAIAIVGASLAYFTDTDKADNVFTTGKVDIALKEDFEQNSKLLPATGSAQNGTLKNGVGKEISVTAEKGSEDTFVRVHIAIPSILDDGDPSFDAKKNVLHFNYDPSSIGEGKWDWSKDTGAPYEGDWNFYTTTIDGINYNVYVVTYGTALKAEETTALPAMHQVYLDSKVTNGDIEKINETLGENWEIKVIAEGCQSAGFSDAYAALNASFGVPGTYTPAAWTTTTTGE